MVDDMGGGGVGTKITDYVNRGRGVWKLDMFSLKILFLFVKKMVSFPPSTTLSVSSTTFRFIFLINANVVFTEDLGKLKDTLGDAHVNKSFGNNV